VTFRFGARSLAELVGVHPELVECSTLALTYSPIDFGVHDGIRDLAQQREYFAAGVSKTLNSKHLKQADGFGHAVDLVPYVAGKLRWELPLCLEIGAAMWKAAAEIDLELTWGAVWDRELLQLDVGNLQAEVEAYQDRRRKLGRKAFIDAPHFELFW
jgi:peptidoglycan L-alanyl-D-glutamate endopeptidase CwlK